VSALGLIPQLRLELVFAERRCSAEVGIAGLLQQFVAGHVVRLLAEVLLAADRKRFAELGETVVAELRP
jgi:hypothetical protein